MQKLATVISFLTLCVLCQSSETRVQERPGGSHEEGRAGWRQTRTSVEEEALEGQPELCPVEQGFRPAAAEVASGGGGGKNITAQKGLQSGQKKTPQPDTLTHYHLNYLDILNRMKTERPLDRTSNTTTPKANQRKPSVQEVLEKKSGSDKPNSGYLKGDKITSVLSKLLDKRSLSEIEIDEDKLPNENKESNGEMRPKYYIIFIPNESNSKEDDPIPEIIHDFKSAKQDGRIYLARNSPEAASTYRPIIPPATINSLFNSNNGGGNPPGDYVPASNENKPKILGIYKGLMDKMGDGSVSPPPQLLAEHHRILNPLSFKKINYTCPNLFLNAVPLQQYRKSKLEPLKTTKKPPESDWVNRSPYIVPKLLKVPVALQAPKESGPSNENDIENLGAEERVPQSDNGIEIKPVHKFGKFNRHFGKYLEKSKNHEIPSIEVGKWKIIFVPEEAQNEDQKTSRFVESRATNKDQESNSRLNDFEAILKGLQRIQEKIHEIQKMPQAQKSEDMTGMSMMRRDGGRGRLRRPVGIILEELEDALEAEDYLEGGGRSEAGAVRKRENQVEPPPRELASLLSQLIAQPAKAAVATETRALDSQVKSLSEDIIKLITPDILEEMKKYRKDDIETNTEGDPKFVELFPSPVNEDKGEVKNNTDKSWQPPSNSFLNNMFREGNETRRTGTESKAREVSDAYRTLFELGRRTRRSARRGKGRKRSAVTATGRPVSGQEDYLQRFKTLQGELEELQNSIASKMRTEEERNLTLQIRVVVDVVTAGPGAPGERVKRGVSPLAVTTPLPPLVPRIEVGAHTMSQQLKPQLTPLKTCTIGNGIVDRNNEDNRERLNFDKEQFSHNEAISDLARATNVDRVSYSIDLGQRERWQEGRKASGVEGQEPRVELSRRKREVQEESAFQRLRKRLQYFPKYDPGLAVIPKLKSPKAPPAELEFLKSKEDITQMLEAIPPKGDHSLTEILVDLEYDEPPKQTPKKNNLIVQKKGSKEGESHNQERKKNNLISQKKDSESPTTRSGMPAKEVITEAATEPLHVDMWADTTTETYNSVSWYPQSTTQEAKTTKRHWPNPFKKHTTMHGSSVSTTAKLNPESKKPKEESSPPTQTATSGSITLPTTSSTIVQPSTTEALSTSPQTTKPSSTTLLTTIQTSKTTSTTASQTTKSTATTTQAITPSSTTPMATTLRPTESTIPGGNIPAATEGTTPAATGGTTRVATGGTTRVATGGTTRVATGGTTRVATGGTTRVATTKSSSKKTTLAPSTAKTTSPGKIPPTTKPSVSSSPGTTKSESFMATVCTEHSEDNPTTVDIHKLLQDVVFENFTASCDTTENILLLDKNLCSTTLDNIMDKMLDEMSKCETNDLLTDDTLASSTTTIKCTTNEEMTNMNTSTIGAKECTTTPCAEGKTHEKSERENFSTTERNNSTTKAPGDKSRDSAKTGKMTEEPLEKGGVRPRGYQCHHHYKNHTEIRVRGFKPKTWRHDRGRHGKARQLWRNDRGLHDKVRGAGRDLWSNHSEQQSIARLLKQVKAIKERLIHQDLY